MLIALAFGNGTTTASSGPQPVWAFLVAGIVAILLSPGFFTLQPNEARVPILLLRIDPEVWADVEYLLREAVRKRRAAGRLTPRLVRPPAAASPLGTA